jgi:hypothetical protein
LSEADPAVTPATISTPNMTALMTSAIHSTRRQAASFSFSAFSCDPPQHPPAICISCFGDDGVYKGL